MTLTQRSNEVYSIRAPIHKRVERDGIEGTCWHTQPSCRLPSRQADRFIYTRANKYYGSKKIVLHYNCK